MESISKEIKCENGICSFSTGAVTIKYIKDAWSLKKERKFDIKLVICFIVSFAGYLLILAQMKPDYNTIVISIVAAMATVTLVLLFLFSLSYVYKGCIPGFQIIGYFYQLRDCKVYCSDDKVMLKIFNRYETEYITFNELMDKLSALEPSGISYTLHKSESENTDKPKLVIDFTNAENADIYVMT